MAPPRGAFFPINVPTRGVRVDALQKDIGPEFLGASENWVLRDGALRMRNGFNGADGFDVYSGSDARIQGLFEYVRADGAVFIAFPLKDRLAVSDGATTTEVNTPGDFNASNDDFSVMRQFTKADDNYLLHTNGVDNPVQWDGDTTDPAADLGGSAPIARSMMVLANRVLLMNIPALNGSAVDVSSEFDFDTGWGNNRVILGDTPGEIVGGLERGNFQGTIFKQDSIWMAEFTGAQDPFGYRMVQKIPGPCSPLAMCDLNFGGFQFYVGQDGNGYLFDGLQANPIGRRFQKFLQSTWNPVATAKISCFYDPEQSEVWVLYPGAGNEENNLALIVKMPGGDIYPQRLLTRDGIFPGYNATVGMKARLPYVITIGDLTGPIGEIDLTLAEMAGTKPSIIFAGYVKDPNGAQVLSLSIEPQQKAFFETALFQATKDLDFVLLDAIEHFFVPTRDDVSVVVEIGTSKYGYDRVFSNTAVTLPVGTGPNISGHRVESRFLSMKLTVTPASDNRFQLDWRGSMGNVNPAGGR